MHGHQAQKKNVVFSVALLPSPKVKINLISRSMGAGPHSHYVMSAVQGIFSASREVMAPCTSAPCFYTNIYLFYFFLVFQFSYRLKYT